MSYPYPAVASIKFKSPPGAPPFSFNKGDRLTVLGQADDEGDWLEGETEEGGGKGVFPASFVERVEEEQPEKQEEKVAAAEPVKQEEGEEGPLAAAVKQGVEQQEGEFPSVDTTITATAAAAEEKKDEDKPSSAEVEAPPPPAPPANPTSPPPLSSGADTITDEPRPTASSPPPSSSASGPPLPAKKPSGLASRLAFFQQEAEKSKGPAPPPKPKPSGGGWKRPAPPAQPAPPAAASPSQPAPAQAPSSATAPPPPMARTTSSSSDSAENAGFSAADAQESISRGGGSLRDRIAALSGGFKADQLQPSAAPGRAPKPWKKPQPAAEEEEGAEDKQEEQEGEVKDSRPAEEETTAQSPGAEVPPFEPAEADPSQEEEGTRAPSHAEPAAEAIAAPLEDDNDEEGFAAPETKEEPRDAPAISTSRETVTDEPRPAASLPSVDVDEPSSASAPVADGEEAHDEQAKRTALAARMAGLGGQKIGGAVGGGGGMIMPALPKRAAGPRRGKSRPAAAAAAAPPVEQGKEEKPVEEKPVEEKAEEKKPDVLASMGGASSLLAKDEDDDEDDARSKVPVDDDDFDSPAPPAPLTSSSSAPLPPPTQPQVYDEPPTASGETVMDEEEFAQRSDVPSAEAERKTIAQEAVEALPDEDGVRELEVVPPETAQLEGANDLAEDGKEEEREEEKAPLARAVAQELERTNEEFDEEENKPAVPPSRPPPPPSGPVDPPAFSSGAETVTDEPRPTAEEPEHEEEEKQDDAPAPPPLPKGRPPIPPSFVRQTTATSDDNKDGEEDERAPIRPPIPTHPPAINLPPVVTPAEAAFIASQPEILSPPEEAMDESTTGVELDAPSVATIAEGHEARDVELAEADKPHVRDSREEGVATPAFEKSPPVFLPASAKPVGGASSVSGAAGGVAGKGESLGLAAVLAKKSLEEGKREEASRLVQPPALQDDGEEAEEAEGEDGEEEEEEEEEEDPEVARRRALAARMAKLGGRGMGPMFGAGFGGLPPAPPAKKKTIKKKKTTEGAGEGAPIEQKQPSEQVEEQVVESQSGSEPPSADGHPPRRIGGIPMGGFALPGIVPPRPREAEMEPEHEEQHVQPAADEDVPSTERGVSQDEYDEVKEQQQQQQGEEEEQAPPPLPPNRPSGGPPRRSVPVPAAEPEQGEQEEQYVDPAADEDYEQQQAQHASHLVDEPEEHDYPHQEEANEMPPPPPPPRPAGGHQSSVPQSPPLPSMSSIPAQSPARGAPPPPQLPEQNLTRSPTQSSRRSSTFLSGAAEKLGFGGSSSPAQSPRQSMDVDSRFDVERVQGGPLGGVASAPGGGAFAARDVDLDTAGMAWWREGGLPRSLQGKGDVLVDVSESTSTKRGTTRVEKEIEVIYNDLSKTLITASFISDDLAEATTSIQQSHFPPPAKANLDSLLQWSASLGAQVFAAAHGLKSSSSARGMSDAQLVEQCFAKATDPLLPVGGTYGVKVFEAVVEQGKKGALVAEDDEPRAGDIAVISAKFKHALTSKTVGSDQQPHLAIIVGYESKKGKLRVIEVNGKNGNVDEESYKVEDMKAGKVTVFRVAPRDYV